MTRRPRGRGRRPPLTLEIREVEGPPVDVEAWARAYVEAVLGPVAPPPAGPPPLDRPTEPES